MRSGLRKVEGGWNRVRVRQRSRGQDERPKAAACTVEKGSFVHTSSRKLWMCSHCVVSFHTYSFLFVVIPTSSLKLSLFPLLALLKKIYLKNKTLLGEEEMR